MRRGWWLAAAGAALALVLAVGCEDTNSSSSDDRPCTTDANCTAEERCINQVCTSKVCSVDEDCLAGETCSIAVGQSSGTCMTISDGDQDADAEKDTDLVGACTAGEFRCQGDLLEQCQLWNSVVDWHFMEECENGCVDGACNPADGDQDAAEEEEAPICTAGDLRCYSNQVQYCEEGGYRWRVEDPCTDGTCTEQPPDAWCGPKVICEAGMRICDPDGTNAIATCNSEGTAWTLLLCASTQQCVNAVCESTGECLNNRYRCTANFTRAEKCVSGNWQVYENCSEGETCVCGQYLGTDCMQAGCQADKICTPFLETRCSGDAVQRCNFDGTAWSTWQNCADDGKTCSNGECV